MPFNPSFSYTLPPPNATTPAAGTATFVVGTTTAYFLIRTNSYSSSKEANRSIVSIPWSQPYTVVLQQGGIKPMSRHYRGVVNSESDFTALALLVNQVGTLTTPREQAVQAFLQSVARGESEDPTDPAGATTVDLSFDILE